MEWFNREAFVVVDGDDVFGPYDAANLCRAMRSAHYAGEDIGAIYVAFGGELRKADVTVEIGEYDDADLAQARVMVDGVHIGGYCVDGRA